MKKTSRRKVNIFLILVVTFLIIITGCGNDTPKDLEKDATVDESSGENELLVPKKEIERSSSVNETIFRKPEENTAKEIDESNSSLGNPEETTEKNNKSSSMSQKEKDNEKSKERENYQEVVGVWISYLDYAGLIESKNETEARKSIESAFIKLKEDGFNTIYLQIRPFSDAIYPSEIYPYSHLLNSEKIQGISPGYDPLNIFIEVGEANNISIHGWINPYRISYQNNPKNLSESNILYNENMTNKDFIVLESGRYINPASSYGQQIVVEGVLEVIKNYDLAGIQFDDYFYPSSESAVDSVYYNEYKNSSGELSLENWRRENVNTLIKKVYSSIKNYDDKILFGISPDASLERNYNQHYADIKNWVDSGYIDYLMPQIYFGFDHESLPFKKTVLDWQAITEKSSVKLIIGLAPYKIGGVDSWAGVGKNEWLESDNLLLDKYNFSKEIRSYGGICLFRYDSIYNPSNDVKAQIEREMYNFTNGIK